MAVDVSAEGIPLGRPRMLFDGGWSLGTSGGLPRPAISGTIGFDVMPDGEHFLIVKADPEAVPTKLHVIFNWLEELKAKAPKK